MTTQFIQKWDLVRFNKETKLSVFLNYDAQYLLLQMVELKSKKLEDYILDNEDNDAEYKAMRQTFTGCTLELPAPVGLELKVHDATNPYRIVAKVRNPELWVSHILGLNVKNKSEKKVAKALAECFGYYTNFDASKLEAGSFSIIDDPRSSADKQRKTMLFGQTASLADFVPGATFLFRNNAHYMSYVLGTSGDDEDDGPIYKGQCITVLSREDEIVDPRLPDWKLATVKLILAQGLCELKEAETRVYTATFGSKNTSLIPYLSLATGDTDEPSSEAETEQSV